ncbi:hypothetical protein [Pigmentiphaga litoralis]|uniref:hypothetical protein n=1 Tax=Pigmentiphaga litoralis TaxID=516702 RepID=UPI003B42D9D4
MQLGAIGTRQVLQDLSDHRFRLPIQMLGGRGPIRLGLAVHRRHVGLHAEQGARRGRASTGWGLLQHVGQFVRQQMPARRAVQVRGRLPEDDVRTMSKCLRTRQPRERMGIGAAVQPGVC